MIEVHAAEGAGQGDCLAPDLGVGPVVVVGGGGEGEPAVVGKNALEDLDGIVVVLEADAVAVVAGGGDLEQERLAPVAVSSTSITPRVLWACSSSMIAPCTFSPSMELASEERG
jgi:hypothetical protein